MMVDTTNFGHYRLTSHAGRKHDLYNRNSGAVHNITKQEYERCYKYGLDACVQTDESYTKA